MAGKTLFQGKNSDGLFYCSVSWIYMFYGLWICTAEKCDPSEYDRIYYILLSGTDESGDSCHDQ